MPLDEIKNWEEISDDFENSDLLIGNGFSIALNDQFSYSSLFESFISNLNDRNKIIFKSFNTTNFETILETLTNAKRVNELFGIVHGDITSSIELLRNGLIEAVTLNHPTKANINWDRIDEFSELLKHFNDIYTLNYDALLYHIILLIKDKYDSDTFPHRYNDYYWERYNETYLKFMDYQNLENYKHVYYLHGALFIFKELFFDVKIKKNNDDEILETIKSKIRSLNFPTFISEGTSIDKRLAISKSDYLRFCFNKLKVNTNKFVIYGASFSSNDNHIIEAINKNIRNIAISIYVADKTEEELENITHNFKGIFRRQRLSFFDSSTFF